MPSKNNNLIIKHKMFFSIFVDFLCLTVWFSNFKWYTIYIYIILKFILILVIF